MSELALGAVLARAVARLGEAGVRAPDVDARLLAAHVLDVGLGEIQRRVLLAAPTAPEDVARFDGLVALRCDRIPVQHLTGRAPFRRLELAVGPGVFVPRPETEQVAQPAIDAAQALVASGVREPVVVDLCTGSGALALAVADEVPAARVVALEVDPEALVWARRNAQSLSRADGVRPGVEIRSGDVLRCDRLVLADLAGAVHVVVSNPPYIPPGAEPVDAEVRDHDPAVALYGGGDDGLEVPRAVVEAAAGLLLPGGLLVMEHAEVQADAARRIAGEALWEGVHTLPDLTGRPRMLVARRRAAPDGGAGAGPHEGVVGDCSP